MASSIRCTIHNSEAPSEALISQLPAEYEIVLSLMDRDGLHETQSLDPFTSMMLLGDLTELMMPALNSLDSMSVVMESSMDDEALEKRDDVVVDVPVETFKRGSMCESEKECIICKSEYEEGEQVSRLACDHVFHTTCITEWGKYKADCPNCRKRMKVCRN
jgi:hypothetical protein